MNCCRQSLLRLAPAMLACALACNSAAPTQKAPAQALPSVHVQTHAAQAKPVPTLLPLTGELISERRTGLSANATGQVVQTLVERGQKVAQGEVLVRLDVRAAQNVLAEAQANVANLKAQRAMADKDCERIQALQKKNAISGQEFDRGMAQCKEVIAQADAAQARLRASQKTIADGAVRAPFAGVITDRLVSVGDFVRADSQVATLLQPDPLRLRMTVPEANLGAAQVGTEVTFNVPAAPGRTFAGVVRYISGEVRAASRDVVVEAVVENHDGALLPGMFASAFLRSGSQDLPVVPRTALLDLGGHTLVYVVKEGRLLARSVRVGPAIDDNTVAILTGIAVGDAVVDAASPTLVDGSTVN